jgi:V8-like Glu-specific endopeptidase
MSTTKLNSFFYMLLIGLMGCGSPEPEASKTQNIFGVDDRETVDSHHPELVASLGRLPHGCTAAMVGRRLALTAAHCVLDKESGDVHPQLGTFEAGFDQGSVSAKTWISAAWVGTENPEQNRTRDWAILLLQDDIGDQTGWLGLEKNLEGEFPVTTNLLAYASDRMAGAVPLITKNCYIHKEDGEGRLLHDCDAVSGSSGGPMFQSLTGKKIHGIAVSEFRIGPISMRRETYSHKFANIAISTNEVSPVLVKLKTSIELGQTPPDFDGVSFMVNLNARSGESDPGGHGTEMDQLKRLAPQLTEQAVLLIEKTSDLKNTAYRLGQTGLENIAIRIEQDSFDLITSLDALRNQPARSDDYAREASGKLGQIKSERSNLETFLSNQNHPLVGSLRAKTQVVSAQIDVLLGILNSQ